MWGVGGMIVTGENRSSRRKTRPNATFPTTNSDMEWSGVEPVSPRWYCNIILKKICRVCRTAVSLARIGSTSSSFLGSGDSVGVFHLIFGFQVDFHCVYTPAPDETGSCRGKTLKSNMTRRFKVSKHYLWFIFFAITYLLS
jgi:hypothetical protein